MDNKKSSSLKKAISIALIGTVCLTAATAVAMTSKTVTVTDGEKTVTINTISSFSEYVYSICIINSNYINIF